MDRTDAAKYVERYSDTILRLGFTYLGSRTEAEDVCQDVLIKLMTCAPAFSSMEHEKAWVLRTTINQCKDVLKSARYRTSVELDATCQHLSAQSAESEALAKESDILSAVQKLPDDQRACVYLFYYEDMKIEDIARMMRKSVSAVTKQLSRARQSLRVTLERSCNE